MKILILTKHLFETDGYGKYSFDFSKEISKDNRVMILLHRKRNDIDFCEQREILKKPSRYLLNPFTPFFSSFSVNKVIKRFNPDIIYFLAEPYATILPFLKVRNSKTYLTTYGTYSVTPILFNNFFKKNILWFLSKKFYLKLNGIITISNFTKNHLLKYYPQLENKIRVITGGIDLKRNKLIDLNKKPKNKIKKILMVGGVKERKGVFEAIKALKYYHDNFSSRFVYDVVGDCNSESNYYQKLIKTIKDCNLSRKVFFRGIVNNDKLQDYYFNADLFLMPSININNNFEGFGLVYLEANSKGVPCIGPKHCGAEDAIVNGKTGYLIDPFNFEEIAQKINLVLNKNSIRKKDCLDWAKQNKIEIKIKEIIDFYGTGNKELKLDIGCGKNKKEGFIGIDIDPKSEADIIASALDLPFDDASVDEINCSHLVEHFTPEEAQRFFDEIYRVLKKGGIVQLKIDRDWSEKRLLRKDPSHQKRYSVEEIKEMVKKFSFSKVERKIYRFGWHIRNKIFVELKK